MIANGEWTVVKDFIAGEIHGAKYAHGIKNASVLEVIDDDAKLPPYETVHSVMPGRVVFVCEGRQYWTFEWIFQAACKKSDRVHP